MVAVTSVDETTIPIALNLGQLHIRVVVVSRMNRASTIRHFANRTKMIACVVIVRATNLLALWVKSFCHVVTRVALFTRLGSPGNPHKLLRARHVPILLLHNFHALAQSVVSEFGSVRANANGS